MSNQLENVLSHPTFDAITVEMSSSSDEQARAALAAAIHSVFGDGQADWDVQQVHPTFPNSFDLIPPDNHTISVKQGFALQYALERQPNVEYAEAMFETYQTDIPEGALLREGVISAEEAVSRSMIKISDDIHELTAVERNPMWVHEMVRTDQVWGLTTGAGVRVGHPDSGYIPHSEFDDDRVLHNLEKDFIDNDDDAVNREKRGGNHGLGTGSALMSGMGKFNEMDEMYVIGTAPDANIVPMRITRKGPPVFLKRSGPRRVREAILHAIDNNCEVVSMSLGGVGHYLLRRALKKAVEANMLVLAAAGNVVPFVVWPALYPEVIAVAACTAEGEKWSLSSFGPSVEITAPGHNVWRAYFREVVGGDDAPSVAPSSGTSFAVALTSGIACLWLAHHGRQALIDKYRPDNLPLQTVFRYLLKKTANPDLPKERGRNFGAGLVDAEALLAAELPTAAQVRADEEAAARSISAEPDIIPRSLATSTAIDDDVADELRFHIVTTPTLRRRMADESSSGVRSAAGRVFYDELAASPNLSDELRERLNMPAEPSAAADTPTELLGDGEKGTVYALLVGVDEYAGQVQNLAGCVNDIEAFGQFLKNRVGGDIGRLALKTLTNQQATRMNVIETWREHFSEAGSADTVIFYYSGHGGQTKSPPEFLRYEPDGYDEGLVCHDSRTPGNWDLADKELAQLISDTAQNDPHIVVILDCCHSGSGTRALEEASSDASQTIFCDTFDY